MAFRTAWWCIKWGSILTALTGAIGYNKGWFKQDDLGSALGIGKTLLGQGAKGASWLSGINLGANNHAQRNTRRSASGRPRTWARANDDGEYDDPAAFDTENVASDVMDKVKESVLTFLATPEQPKKKAGQKKPNKNTQKKEGNGPGDWATGFLFNKARRAWDEFQDRGF
jgi:hypothetical protein